METAITRIADRGAAAECPAAEAKDEAAAAEPRSEYIRDLYDVIDDIEGLFPEVVRVLRERIADLEGFLAKERNPFIQHGAIAATHEVVQAVRRVIKRIAK